MLLLKGEDMIEAKAFKVFDDGTVIPIVAFKARPISGGPGMTMEKEQKIMARAGYYGSAVEQVVVVDLINHETQSDPFGWKKSHGRTMHLAHMALSGREHPDFKFVAKNFAFDELESGAVIDVEYILGETNEIKKFE